MRLVERAVIFSELVAIQNWGHPARVVSTPLRVFLTGVR